MTPQQAKALSIKVWQYLADHPEINLMPKLPNNLWYKISGLQCQNPLCEVQVNHRFHRLEPCKGCPICDSGNWCGYCGDNLYSRWFNLMPEQTELRKEAAQKILDIIKAWEPEEAEK